MDKTEPTLQQIATDIQNFGYCMLPGLLTPAAVQELIEAVQGEADSGNGQSAGANTYAVRNLLYSSARVRSLAIQPHVLQLVKSVLGPSARAVKATFFDKTPGANWKVPPHQDVTIAVREKAEAPGFGPWTIKADIHNVQPPVQILEQMLALRFHLDDCDEKNGALKVWPGSHTSGRLKDAGIAEWLSNHDPVTCPVPKGGVMLMRPLLLHASSPATNPTHRRVIHIEYAGLDLPNGLRWLDELWK